MHYDVVIVGGGPAGLTAALMLGRGRKRVLLLDAGAPRNAAATAIHGFVTRDGTPPALFRQIGREQLAPYSSVEVCLEPALAIDGEADAFTVTLATRAVSARRVLLCTGLIDVLPGATGKDATLRYMSDHLGLSFDDVLFAGDSGNDRAALLSGWLGILVGNAEASFALELASAARAAGLGDRLFLATKPGAAGVLEGCRHFGFLHHGPPEADEA